MAESSPILRSALTVLVMLAAPAHTAAADRTAAAGGEWNFRVLLDGEPIGEHRFTVTAHDDQRDVASQASFTVKILGFTAYRYRHQASERWNGDCLTAVSSNTDDDGRASDLHLDRQTAPVAGEPPTAPRLEGCVMSFAYWNPAIRTQTRLLNVQTGKLEDVHVQGLGAGTVEVHGKPVAALGYRIVGTAQPIDVWYSAQGEWIGLDSVVRGSRKLSYRLP